MSMLSSEISDLESFIDSYVAPEKSTGSPANWSRTHSYEEGYSGSLNSASFIDNHAPPLQNSGTEFWGERPGGNEWSTPAHARSLHQEWTEYRPRIQERAPQWPQHLMPEQTNQDFHLHWNAPHPTTKQLPQDPNQIQAIVSDLIRQNNMNKSKNFPDWVDVTKPPPSLPPNMPMAPLMHDNLSNGQQYFQPQMNENLMHQEPILHSMTFQRSTHDPTNVQSMGFPPQSNLPQGETWGASSNVNPQMHSAGPPPWHDPRQRFQPPLQPPFQQEETQPDFTDFQNEIMHGGHYESPDLDKQQVSVEHMRQQQIPQMTSNASVHVQQSNTIPVLPQESVHIPANTEAYADPKMYQTQSSTESTQEKKYPNSKLRTQHSWGDDDDVGEKKSLSRRSSENVFENERDERWKTQSKYTSSQYRNRQSSSNNQRRVSAADEDLDWRRRDSAEEQSQKINNRHKRRSSSDIDDTQKRNSWENTGSKQNRFSTSSSGNKEAASVDQPNKPAKKDQVNVTDSHDTETHRHLTQTSKFKVQSWLEDGKAPTGDSVGQEIRKLQITESEADLTKFIETTQTFATTEAKMREVAEILCNKALKDPKFGRSASILCDRMSFMMVHGTKFRSVVLNVMQGHYRNRDHLYAASFRKDKRWFGFASFLAEIFLNVRTSTKERLVVLVSPVFNSLFQVLTGKTVDKEHIECFATLFARVGPALECEDPSRMSELMGEIRDRCVLSKTPVVKRRLLGCVELYASKWETSPS